MNTGADAADQIVKMSLEGVEVAAKITGTGAKELAVLLCALLKDQTQTSGKTWLGNMLRSGKELKVFAVKTEDLKKFCEAAKQYGVLYCVLKEKNATDGLTDIMVRAEDASKINRIFERFQLATVDVGQIQKELEQLYGVQEPQLDPRTQEGAEKLVDKLLQNATENPPPARTTSPHLSGPSSEVREAGGSLDGDDPFPRRSVRKELKKLQEQQRGGQQITRTRFEKSRNATPHKPRKARRPRNKER